MLSAIRDGYTDFFIPADNIYEVEYISGIRIYPVSHFRQIVDHFFGDMVIAPYEVNDSIDDLYTLTNDIEVDFAHIK